MPNSQMFISPLIGTIQIGARFHKLSIVLLTLVDIVSDDMIKCKAVHWPKFGGTEWFV